jgi:ABC-2 type transport system permease protein
VGHNKNIIATVLNEERGKLGNYFFFPMTSAVLLNQIDTLDAIISVVKNHDLSRSELLAIDQCLMADVPIIWLVDKYPVSIDSIGIYGEFMAQPSTYQGAEDMLFKHGLRLSVELLQNLDCSAIPQVVGQEGGRAKTELIPFPYHVLGQIESKTLGAISDKVNMNFVTPIEVLTTSTKTVAEPLLISSQYSKLNKPPLLLSFEFLRFEPNAQEFKEGSQNLAVALSGEFDSYFSNRLTEIDKAVLSEQKVSYQNSTVSGKEVVVNDVDFALPKNASDGSVYPLGFNFWDRKKYDGNRYFLKALLEYMVNDGEMLAFSKKEIKTSLIDKSKFDAKSTWYYFVLLGLPSFGAILLVLLVRWIRKLAYAKTI